MEEQGYFLKAEKYSEVGRSKEHGRLLKVEKHGEVARPERQAEEGEL